MGDASRWRAGIDEIFWILLAANGSLNDGFVVLDWRGNNVLSRCTKKCKKWWMNFKFISLSGQLGGVSKLGLISRFLVCVIKFITIICTTYWKTLWLNLRSIPVRIRFASPIHAAYTLWTFLTIPEKQSCKPTVISRTCSQAISREAYRLPRRLSEIIVLCVVKCFVCIGGSKKYR